MTPRENLLSLLRRNGFERIPLAFTLCPALETTYREQERSHKPYAVHFEFPLADSPMPLQLDINLARYQVYHDMDTPGLRLDQWGVGRRIGTGIQDVSSPLASATTVDQIKQYPLPKFLRSNNKHMRAAIEAIKARGLCAVGRLTQTIWDTACALRGMDNLLMDMVADSPMATELLDALTQTAISRCMLYVDAGVDLLILGDVLGTERSSIMSISLYKTWLKPRLDLIVQTAKRINPDVLIVYHASGYIEPYVPLLIESGIECLAPMQPDSMDYARMQATYGDTLSFLGTIDAVSTMENGSADDVRKAVIRNLDIAGEKGGLFPMPTQMLSPQVPWENVLAYVQACRDYTA